MAHPNQSATDRKPVKPRPDFPHGPSADGRWQKKIHGKVFIFAGTADEALKAYEEKLESFGEPDPGTQQMRHLCDAFMVSKETN